MSRSLCWRLALSISFHICSLNAQVITGTILGTVTDPNNFAIKGASVRIRHEGTNIINRTTTSASGDYSVPLLPPGSYEVVIEAIGFKTYQKTDLVLTIDDKIRADEQLEVGWTTE